MLWLTYYYSIYVYFIFKHLNILNIFECFFASKNVDFDFKCITPTVRYIFYLFFIHISKHVECHGRNVVENL